MVVRTETIRLGIGLLVCSVVTVAEGQDWPQWRGPNRDARVEAFKAPPNWTEELSQKWKVAVGYGVSTRSPCITVDDSENGIGK